MGELAAPQPGRLYDAARRSKRAGVPGPSSTHDENIFDYLERELTGRRLRADDVPFDLAGGYVGYLGYEVKAGSGSALRHHRRGRTRWCSCPTA